MNTNRIILYYDKSMYNEFIFSKLKAKYVETVTNRRQDLLLDYEHALSFIQNKYKITPLNPLKDKVLSLLNEFIYYDCSLEHNKDIVLEENAINSQQARVDRKDNRCFSAFDIQILAHHFYLLHEIENEDIIYAKILKYLSQCISCGNYYCLVEERLPDFFNCAIDLYLLNKYKDDLIDKNKSKVIIAINRFKLEYLKDFKINMDRIESLNDVDAKIHKIIENNIKILGGYKTLKLIFDIFLKETNKKFERYLIFRNRNGLGNSNTPFPFQYIIHIACKYLSNFKNTNITNNDISLFQKIVEDAIAYVDLLEIFEENPWAEINPRPEAIPFLIKENILLECLCFPIQYSPKYIIEILQGLYLPFAKIVANIPKMYNCSSYVSFVKYILKLSPNSVITAKLLSSKLKTSISIIKEYLDYFSQNSQNVNINFNEAFKETNLYDKPLIKLDEERYFYLCTQFCGYSFLKVLYEDMSTYYNGNDKTHLGNKFGTAIEKFVYKLLENKNYAFKHGWYALETVDKGECDIILEDTDRTVFIEMKNSGIDREFELGNDVKVLNQLGRGSLFAQKQILHHKVFLLKNNNECDLFESQKSITPLFHLNVNDKRIFAVSLCGAEALFFTSGLISQKLMETLSYTRYTVKEGKDNELKDLNKTAEEVSKLTNDYYNIDSSITLYDIFHFSTIKSLQQFWYALNQSNNITEFINNLVHDTWMQNYSSDFCVNLIQHLELEKYKKESK